MRMLLMILLASAVAAAQAPAERETTPVEVDPITCWWRTTASGVRIGEPFDVVLTCSVLQTEAARVLPDESRLDPAVVQLPPFEVLDGARGDDIETAGRRFFQYRYRVRLISETAFGTDPLLPSLELTYRIESRVEQGDALQGRDRSYALPTMPVRVLSLVPDTALDIREAPVPTFGDIEDVAFRGIAMRTIAGVLVALGSLLLVVAAVRLLRRRQSTSPEKARVVPERAILRGVRRELEDVRAQGRQDGWTPELAGRALGALRIAAAYAIGRPVSQQRAAAGAVPLEGQLLVHNARRTTALVSAAVTAGNPVNGASRRPAVAAADVPEPLREGIARLTAARYGRAFAADGARLDDALEEAIRIVDRAASDRPWLERVWSR